jgi:methyl-accepting chemotaxis protein
LSVLSLVHAAKRSVGIKLLLPILLSVCAGLAALTWVVAHETAGVVERLATGAGEEMAGRIAAKVETDVIRPLQIARTLRDTFVRLERSGVHDRAVYLAILRDVVAANRATIGGWAVWDADGFGAMVPDAARVVQGSNPDGSFSPYAVNQANGTTVQVLDDYNKPGNGDYYLLAHRSGHEAVLEPYKYAVEGVGYLVTSVAVPIIVDGKPAGVVGIDASLNGLSSSFGALHPYQSGAVAILSADNRVVAAAGMAKLGEPAETLAASLHDAAPRVAAGEGFHREGWSDLIGAEAIEIYVPVKLGETSRSWSVVVSLPKAALLAPARRIALFVAGAGLLVLAMLSSLVAIVVRQVISRRMQRLAKSIERVAAGDTTSPIGGLDQADELGVMARAVDLSRRNILEVAALRDQREAAKQAAEQERRHSLATLAEQFEASVRSVVDAVASASRALSGHAATLARSADTSTSEARAVTDLTAVSATNVAGVAAAAEQLTGSIQSISRQIGDGTAAMRAATAEVERIGAIAGTLAGAAESVGGVVRMISDIASQTNLLALNATIEAARAGEAGKGFAVVAHEVKSLANQTANATGEISRQITEIQTVSQAVVSAIGEIGQSIARTNDITISVSSAVDAQTRATDEISGSSQRASDVTAQVAQKIEGVSHAAHDADVAAASVLEAARQLAADSHRLEQQVDGFVGSLRAKAG